MKPETKLSLWIKSMLLFQHYWGCHQIPARSFSAYGYQFPLCARCTGILAGEIAVIFILIAGYRISVIATISWMLPLIIDGSLQLLYVKYESTNLRRFITGALFGMGIGFLLFRIIETFIEGVMPQKEVFLCIAETVDTISKIT